MQILIKEENGFMPTTRINIYEDRIEFTENNQTKTLKYTKEEIKVIMHSLLDIMRDWKNRYEEKKIIDDEIYTITIVTKENKQYYIKNKYPSNWSSFIFLRNKLVREEIKL